MLGTPVTKSALIVVAAGSLAVCVPAVIAFTTPTPVVRSLPRNESVRVMFANATLPRSGDSADNPRRVRSLLNIRKPLQHGQFIWNDTGVAAGPVWLRVDVKAQTISVFRAGHEIGTAVVLYGADKKPTPLGTFAVLDKRRDHVSSLYDAPMPYTLRLTNDGISIHGGDVKLNYATHGCVGVPVEFAALLFEQVKVGDEVDVVNFT